MEKTIRMKDICYYKDGTTSEKWDSSKTPHREDGPARIKYYKDGAIEYEDYYVEGKSHREDGPARIGYYKDGSIYYECYYIEDKYHREDGPAIMRYSEDGSISYEAYYIEGKYLWKNDYTALIKEISEMNPTLKLIDNDAWVRKLGKEEYESGAER